MPIRLFNGSDVRCFAGNDWVSYFYAMQVSSVAIGVVALYTYPVITVFLEPLFHWKTVPH